MREEYRRIFGRKVRNIRLLNKTKSKNGRIKASRIFGSRRTQRNRAVFAKIRLGYGIRTIANQLSRLGISIRKAQGGVAATIRNTRLGYGTVARRKIGRLGRRVRAYAKIRPSRRAYCRLGVQVLQSIPEVTVTLSGMSNLEQVKANIETYRHDKPLTDDECATLLAIADEMVGATKLPCTECRYCTAHCPKGLDIPALIKLYNEHRFTGGGLSRLWYCRRTTKASCRTLV